MELWLGVAFQTKYHSTSGSFEILGYQALLVSRTQDVAPCGSQEMGARTRLTVN